MLTAKTLWLIHAYTTYRALNLARQVIAFRPHVDTRTKGSWISSRLNPKEKVPAKVIAKSTEMLELIKPRHQLVLIDEGQFFDEKIEETVRQLRAQATVLVAALDRDFRGKPFGHIGALMATATEVVKLKAVCDVCRGGNAEFSQLLVDGEPASAFLPSIMPEGKNQNRVYVPRCRTHFVPPADLDAWVAKQRR